MNHLSTCVLPLGLNPLPNPSLTPSDRRIVSDIARIEYAAMVQSTVFCGPLSLERETDLRSLHCHSGSPPSPPPCTSPTPAPPQSHPLLTYFRFVIQAADPPGHRPAALADWAERPRGHRLLPAHHPDPSEASSPQPLPQSLRLTSISPLILSDLGDEGLDPRPARQHAVHRPPEQAPAGAPRRDARHQVLLLRGCLQSLD